MTSLSIVVFFFTSVLLLSSSVNAFISTSNQPIKNTHISTSLLSAYIDENYPHATTTRGVSNEEESESINGNNSKEQKQPTTTNTKRPSKILPNGAKLTLVGAGPGSPDLLTLAAHKIITNPNNYLIVDRLVSQEILDLIQGEYKVANKYRGCADIAQEEIYDWCKDGLREGKHVVRLKIGDPFVFGRGGEEVLEFRNFGIEPTIIPGVSAAFSAPLLGSIPVTHRGVSNQVVMCTGYGRNNTSPDLIQYHKEQTVVFLMAVGRLRSLCDNLVEKAHYPRDTPVGIVERAGCPDQRTVVGTMRNIADLAEEYNVKPPSTIVVGEVVNVLLTEEDFGNEIEHCKKEGKAGQGQGLVQS